MVVMATVMEEEERMLESREAVKLIFASQGSAPHEKLLHRTM